MAVYKALGMDRHNFGKLRKHEDFENALETHDIELAWGNKNARGFRRQFEEPPLDGEFEDYFPPVDDVTG